MLLKYLIKPPAPVRYQTLCSKAVVCSFATSTSFERTIEYEIDLISLKRTGKRHVESAAGNFRFNPFNAAKLESKLINPEIVTKSVNEVQQDPLDYKSYSKSDNKGYIEFIERYNFELRKFIEFIQHTDERNIQTLDQLTSEEVLSALNVFKDYYQKGKVEGINKYNCISYNYMYERLCKYLRFDSNFPVVLQNNLTNEFNDKNTIMSLYEFGIGKFVKELESLSRDFPFGKLNTADITDAIDRTIKQYDRFLQASETNVNFNEAFFKGCIQIQRYKNLKCILEALPVKATHLLYILNNENSKLIISKINDLSGEKDEFKKTVTIFQPELNFVNHLSKDSFKTFPKLASYLYRLSITTDDTLTKNISITLLEQLTPFFTNGTLEDSDLHIIELETIQKATISNILRENYEFSALAKIELFNFVNELKMLRAFSGKKFEDLDVSEALEYLDKLVISFKGSSLIVDKLQILKLELSALSRYVSWNLSVLDKLIEVPSWISYLNEASKSDADKSGTSLDFSKRKQEISQYKQIPEDLYLHDFFVELEVIKSDLLGGYDFKLFSPVSITSVLENAIDEVQAGYDISPQFTGDSVGNYIKLNRKLKRLFNYNGGYTDILDIVIYSQSVFESVGKKQSLPAIDTYTQIPDDSELHKFSKELNIVRTELGTSYKACSPDQIENFLKSRINDAFNDVESLSSISKENLQMFVKLEENLSKFFKISQYTAILDTLIHSQSVFEDFERKKLLKSTNKYTQIPDSLELHKFCKILKIFREDELKGIYGSHLASEIISLMDQRINEIKEHLPTSKISSRVNETNVHDFMLLAKRITILFEINGENTSILDTLIESQSIFDKLEVSKAKSVEYKQVPDSFMLEEYMLELIQLRLELGGHDFKSFDCATILNTLKMMINNKKKFNSDRRAVYSKLYRNISYLFKYNGNNSFILDNVLVSGEVFAKFEADNALEKIQKSNSSIFSQNATFVNESGIALKLLFELLGLHKASDFIGLTALEFDKNVSKLLLSKEDKLPEYAAMLDKISFFSLKVKNYPFFLYSLVQKKSNGAVINSSLAKLVYEESNQKMFEIVEENQSKIKLSIPISDSSNKFDISEFIESNKSSKQEYSDSSALLSSLSKQRSSVDFFKHYTDRNYTETLFSNENLVNSEAKIRDAVVDALNTSQSRSSAEVNDERKELQNLTPEKVRQSFKTYRPSNSSSISTTQIDKSSIESFLNNAKREKDLAKERKFRESKAYEWSRGMYNSHRSLELHNFFDPIVPISKMSKESKQLFFPSFNSGDFEYILLTVNGQTIMSKENPLGKNNLPEDMFTILNKFSEHDLGKFIKNVKKLQKNNWKLIGGGSEKEKMLVLARSTSSKKDIYLSRLKSMFATTGAVFLILVSLNLWLDDDAGPLVVPERKSFDAAVSPQDTKEHPIINVNDSSEEQEFSWKKLLWSTK